MELDKIPLWRGDHVAVRQLIEDFARYVYLPRLRDPDVVLGAVRDGLGLLLWQHETFAYADGYDEASGRYRGLRCGQRVEVIEQAGEGLLVKSEVALKQQDASAAAAATTTDAGATAADPAGPAQTGGSMGATVNGGARPNARPHRFHGTVTLDAARVGRDAGRVADEVIAHLSGLVGAKVTVTLEIQAIVPDGVPDNAVRTVTENSRQLKFSSHGFEVE
jgi:hypothetical protein